MSENKFVRTQQAHMMTKEPIPSQYEESAESRSQHQWTMKQEKQEINKKPTHRHSFIRRNVSVTEEGRIILSLRSERQRNGSKGISTDYYWEKSSGWLERKPSSRWRLNWDHDRRNSDAEEDDLKKNNRHNKYDAKNKEACHIKSAWTSCWCTPAL